MYEAPDRYKRMISARLPDGEVASGSPASRSTTPALRCSDVQLISRAQFAPFFAAANIVAALIMIAALWDEVVPCWPVAAGRWPSPAPTSVAMQLARTQAVTHVGRSGQQRAATGCWSAKSSPRACIWLSLPLYVFTSLAAGRPGHRRLDRSPGSASPRSAWSSSRAASIAWMVGVHRRLCRALFSAATRVPFQHMLSILFTLGVAIFGVSTVARWAFGQLKTNADFGAQSESASLLLQEYEHRGVGWLWQVDGENRVIYISLADDRPARPPDQPVDRPFAAGAARRPAALGRDPARAAALHQSRDGAEDARAARAGSRSRATRSSTWPAASRASAASARTSPRSARPRNG